MSNFDNDQARVGLGQVLERAGVLTDPAWARVFGQVDRAGFAPEQVWVPVPGGYAPLSRQQSPARWWELVYSDTPIVTQVEDGGPVPHGRKLPWTASSSASMPSIVLGMLGLLDVANGMRTLEIGTGTGYNAALLSARLGEDLVTTVEIDPVVSAAAVRSLAGAGFHPTVATGDGTKGYAANAPYSRIISTYAVHEVSYAWIQQTEPGGVIVTPWGTPFNNSGLVRLVVRPDGQAVGRFVGSVNFMWDRGQRPDQALIRQVVSADHQPSASTTDLNPRAILEEHAAFTVGLLVPGCREVTVWAPDDSGRFTFWALACDRQSWASVSYEPEQTRCEVEQYGPRQLWDEIETAYEWWKFTGSPERERFGVTVTPENQWVWLDHRDSENCWEIPR